MLKIWTLKKQGENEDATATKGGGPVKKVTAAQIRVQKDITELALPDTMAIEFANPEDLMNFTVTIVPDEGMYKNGRFKFSFKIDQNYPHDPPKVKCLQKIYHPNIDLEGNVCLNILREDWKPVLSLNSIMVGLQYLFLEPNPDDPLNKTAANDLRQNHSRFKTNVINSMKGGYIGEERFDKVTSIGNGRK